MGSNVTVAVPLREEREEEEEVIVRESVQVERAEEVAEEVLVLGERR